MNKFMVLYKLVKEDYNPSLCACNAHLEVVGVRSCLNYEENKAALAKLSRRTSNAVRVLPGFVNYVSDGWICDIYEPKSDVCSSHLFGTCAVDFAVTYEVR